MRKTQMWLGGVLIGLAGCAGQTIEVATEPQAASDDFDIFAFIEGDDAATESVATSEPAPAPVTEVVALDVDDFEADAADEDAVAQAETDPPPLDVDELGDPADSMTEQTLVATAPVADEQAADSAADMQTSAEQEPVAVRLDPLDATDDTEALVVGDDLVVHVVPASTPPPPQSGARTVTLANTRSAPVPDAVFDSIEARLKKAGFTVVGSAYGDYLVICGRIPPRTMWGRSESHGRHGGPYVRASSLAEPLGVPLTRPDGGTWQAVVEIAFEIDDYDQQLRLRELHTIFSGDIRKVRRRDAAGLSRLNDTLDGWAASYGHR